MVYTVQCTSTNLIRSYEALEEAPYECLFFFKLNSKQLIMDSKIHYRKISHLRPCSIFDVYTHHISVVGVVGLLDEGELVLAQLLLDVHHVCVHPRAVLRIVRI